MVKKLLLTFLLLSVVGCSFSKKSAEEKAKEAAEAKSRASVDDVVGDQRYTLVEKLETAILKRDRELFSVLLTQASPQILNKSKSGKTLGERAIDTGDLFFLRGLIEAGMSPYLSSEKVQYGLSFYAMKNRYKEGQEYLYQAIDELLHRATKICLVADVQALISFLDENLIPPVDKVCGTMNLFSYYFGYRSYDSNIANQVLTKYIVQSRSDYKEIGQALLIVAFTSKSENLWKKISDLYEFSDLRFYGRDFENKINNSTLESVLESYLAIQQITTPKLLNNIRFYVRAKIQNTDLTQDELLKDLIAKAGFDSPAQEGLEVPFKDRDCDLPNPFVVPPSKAGQDEEPPPPMGTGVYQRELNDLRLCR